MRDRSLRFVSNNDLINITSPRDSNGTIKQSNGKQTMEHIMMGFYNIIAKLELAENDLADSINDQKNVLEEIKSNMEKNLLLRKDLLLLEIQMNKNFYSWCEKSVSLGNNLSSLIQEMRLTTTGVVEKSVRQLESMYKSLYGNCEDRFSIKNENDTKKQQPIQMEGLPTFLNQMSIILNVLDSSFELKSPLVSLHKVVSSKIESTNQENNELQKKLQLLKIESDHIAKEKEMTEIYYNSALKMSGYFAKFNEHIKENEWSVSDPVTSKKANIFLSLMTKEIPIQIKQIRKDNYEQLLSAPEKKLVTSEEVSMEKMENKNILKGTSLKKMMEFAFSNVQDHYGEYFILTFRKYCKPMELLSNMIIQFCCSPPSDISPENIDTYDSAGFNNNFVKYRPRRAFILDLLVKWIEVHPYDFKNCSKEFSKTLNNFIENSVTLTGHSKIAEKIRKVMEKGVEKKVFTNRIESCIPKSNFCFLDLDTKEIARQMTITDAKFFGSFELREFFNQNWNNKLEKKTLAPNITASIEQFNKVSAWVCTTIVSVTDLSHRTLTLSKFISIADECLNLQNFNGCFAIMGGLGNSSVSRLKKTWEGLKKIDYSRKEKFSNLMEKNFSGMKKKLMNILNTPCVPYIGVFLTELTFLDEQPNYLDDMKKMINVPKMKVMGGILSTIFNMQCITYSFNPVPQILNFIQSAKVLNDNETFELSKKIESKTKKKKINNTQLEDLYPKKTFLVVSFDKK
eukprot:TRINITY_DN2579_c4_g1_i1.p1 TRINITY_DN2579_c4_g1~~TRINITY_DN2579_c4_g1_i1.p1  ORF type:complete len:739 (-),score=224.48 TRINITY_DN2579_c4_g1_i1:129-2345(-)